MKLSEYNKKIIVERYHSSNHENFNDFSEVVEYITDHLLKENIIDISEDENGDAHEDLYNSVWEYLESLLFNM
jgi:hypothetical protein